MDMKKKIIDEFKKIQASIGLSMVGFAILEDGIHGVPAWLLRHDQYDGWLNLLLGFSMMAAGLIIFIRSKKKILDMSQD